MRTIIGMLAAELGISTLGRWALCPECRMSQK